ncbi:MAG TPA: TIM barrel protein [Chloroflexota bacterium]|nr:TIM barrel protein [Chloroflexota bacterium]
MSLGCAPRARILLKARPTPEQLADRLRPPRPEGLELYLDGRDIATPAARAALVERVRACALPPDFALVVEGPIRGLDGAYFDLADPRPANRALFEVLAELGAELGATGLVIHAIVPRFALAWDPAERAAILARCATLLGAYVAAARARGLVPTLENVPPVLRMREARYLYTPVGMSPEDMVWLLDRAPGLAATLDVSHAQLYVNARRAADAEGAAEPGIAALYAYLRHLPPIAGIERFVEALADRLFEVHVSNAAGLLGEGLPYGEGDLDLDALIVRLARHARFLVTETLEADHDRAVRMREAQARMAAALRAAGATVP